MEINFNNNQRTESSWVSALGPSSSTTIVTDDCSQPVTIQLFLKLKTQIDQFSRQFNRQKVTLRLIDRFLKSNNLVSSSDSTANVDQTKLEKFNRDYRVWDKKLKRFHRKKKLLVLNNLVSDLYQELLVQQNSKDKVVVPNGTDKITPISLNNNEVAETTTSPIDTPVDDDIIDITPVRLNNTSTTVVDIVKQSNQSNVQKFKKKSDVTSFRKACSFSGCKQKFSSKKALLNHLFEHSINPNFTPKSKSKKSKKKNNSPLTRHRAKRSLNTELECVDVDAPRPKRQYKKRNYTDLAGGDLNDGEVEIGETLAKDLRRKSKILEDADSEYDPDDNGDGSDGDKKSRRFRCNFEGCQYAFPALAALRNHEKSHSNLKEFECHICSARFKYKPNLTTHIKLHEGIRYHCAYEGCSSSYTIERLLHRHVKVVHTKEAPTFACDWEGCNYVATSNDRLNKHRPVHTRERKHHCPWPDCDKSFAQYGTMRSHMLIHKNERKYRCTVVPGCSFDCNTNSNLRKHLLAHERKNELSEPLDVLVKRMRANRNNPGNSVLGNTIINYSIEGGVGTNSQQEIDQQVTYLNSFLN